LCCYGKEQKKSKKISIRKKQFYYSTAVYGLLLFFVVSLGAHKLIFANGLIKSHLQNVNKHIIASVNAFCGFHLFIEICPVKKKRKEKVILCFGCFYVSRRKFVP